MTLVERPADASALDVLSLRLGLHAALAVQPFADVPVGLKWPNDLYVSGRKLAGVLVEARWREARPEWVAIGFGLNVRAPADFPAAAGLDRAPSRLEVLVPLVRALRAGAAARGPLTGPELASYAARDVVRGRRLVEPVAGTVRGVAPSGELEVAADDGAVVRLRQATVTFAD